MRIEAKVEHVGVDFRALRQARRRKRLNLAARIADIHRSAVKRQCKEK